MAYGYKEIQKPFAEILPRDEPTSYQMKLSANRKESRMWYQNWFLKIAEEESVADNLYREGRMLQILQDKLKVGVPNPTILFRRDTFPFAGFAYQQIEGKSIPFNSPNEEELKKLVPEITVLWDNIQKLVKFSEIRQNLRPYKPNLENYAKLIQHKKISNHIHSNDMNKILRYLDLCNEYLKFDLEKFVHGDFWYGNMLYDPVKSKIVGLLDFSRCWYSDPAIDMAKLGLQRINIVKDVLNYYNQNIRSINVQKYFLRVMLHRGLFIIRKLVKTKNIHRLTGKLNIWIIRPLSHIQQLVSEI